MGLLVCIASVAFVVFLAVEPRLHHAFPSMIDDWNAIASGGGQLHDVIRLGNPEGQRYRPGFVAWNALQWHTLGTPTSFVGPRLWELVRLGLLVVGITALAWLLVIRGRDAASEPDLRWLLTLAVPLIVLTAPAGAIDLARYGPQEPLLVGCMSLGAVLLVLSLDRLLDPGGLSGRVIASIVIGFVIWSFGVLQKETSLCVLLLAPFLLPSLRSQRLRWARLDGARRLTIGAVAAAIILPFVPMAFRTVQLTLADSRVYEGSAAGRSFYTRAVEQIGESGESLHSPVFWLCAVISLVAVTFASFRTGVDWLTVGLLVPAAGFVAFAAESGVVASRYYLPPLTLLALAGARSLSTLRATPIAIAGALVVLASVWQLREAREWVEWWVDGERTRETLVREAAARAAGGCSVDVMGRNVELVLALPVLMPIAEETPHSCEPGQRFIVFLDWSPGETPAEDAMVAACAPEPEPVWEAPGAKIVRCSQPA